MEFVDDGTEDALLKTRMVVNSVQKRSHLYTRGVFSVCNQWRCGSPDEPTVNAVFDPTDSRLNGLKLAECNKCRTSHSVLKFMESAIAEVEQEPAAIDSSGTSSSEDVGP